MTAVVAEEGFQKFQDGKSCYNTIYKWQIAGNRVFLFCLVFFKKAQMCEIRWTHHNSRLFSMRKSKHAAAKPKVSK